MTPTRTTVERVAKVIAIAHYNGGHMPQWKHEWKTPFRRMARAAISAMQSKGKGKK